MMKTLVIIVNHNGTKLLEENISSVVDTKDVDFDICVVDNASSDSSVSFLEKKYPGIKIIKSDTNLGYGKAHNIALEKYPNYDYYAFLNNDIKVTPYWLKEMLEVFNQKQNIGAVGPKILLSKKSEKGYIINSAGMDITKHYLGYDRFEGEYDRGKYNTTEKVDGICGAVMLVPREVLKKVKGFSPKIFLYYEDIDLSLRITDLGYDIYYCGSCVVYHEHMATAQSLGRKKRNSMNLVNRYYSIKGRLGAFVAIKETLWYLCCWIVWKIFHSKTITLKQYLDGR